MNLVIETEGADLFSPALSEFHSRTTAVDEEGPAEDALDIAQIFIALCQTGHSHTTLLTARFEATIRALGFRYFACCAHVDPQDPPPQAMMIHNYPAAWMKRISEGKLYKIDPVWQRAERDPVPFFWDTAFQSTRLTPAQQNLLAEAAGFGLAHGYTVPIHLSWLPGAVRTSCSVVPEATTVGTRECCLVDMIANALYAATRHVQPPRRAGGSVELSRRERQCLGLAAQGKDDWAIGQLLGLSPKTVHSYFKRLMQRLGVRTRVQAIVWALESGQMYRSDDPTFIPISAAGTKKRDTL